MQITGTERQYGDEEMEETRSFRINFPMTQEELAEESGFLCGQFSEWKGESVQTKSDSRMSAMGILSNMERLIPQEEVRPSDLFLLGSKGNGLRP